jgi:hypothetical protein
MEFVLVVEVLLGHYLFMLLTISRHAHVVTLLG